MSEVNQIVAILGGSKTIGKAVKTTKDLMRLIQDGLPFGAYRHVQDFIGFQRPISGELPRIFVAQAKHAKSARPGIKRLTHKEGKPYTYGVSTSYLTTYVGAADPFHISSRTLSRRKEAKKLNREESDRVMRVARVAAHAVDVFGNEEKARTWLNKPCRALGGAIPTTLLDTDLGVQAVDKELHAIGHGLFA